MHDQELARRGIANFGEIVAALGRGADRGVEIRRSDAIGARILMARDNPWFDAVVVPAGALPPTDDPSLPLCVWTLQSSAPGRIENGEIAMPLMGRALDDLASPAGDLLPIQSPPLEVVGALNERAYDDFGVFGPLVSGLRDDRVATYGVMEAGQFVCVALTLRIGDDLGIHYVATEQARRGRGLASRLLGSIMAAARDEGFASATLQASADGLSVYERLGFRRVGTLRAFMRPDRADEPVQP